MDAARQTDKYTDTHTYVYTEADRITGKRRVITHASKTRINRCRMEQNEKAKMWRDSCRRMKSCVHVGG